MARLNYLKKRAKAGSANSAYMLARVYYDGDSVPINYEKAFKWLSTTITLEKFDGTTITVSPDLN